MTLVTISTRITNTLRDICRPIHIDQYKFTLQLPLLLKPIFHLASLFVRREAKTRIRQSDWLKLAGEKLCREQVGSVPTFLSVCVKKFAKWKIGLRKILT